MLCKNKLSSAIWQKKGVYLTRRIGIANVGRGLSDSCDSLFGFIWNSYGKNEIDRVYFVIACRCDAVGLGEWRVVAQGGRAF